MSRRPPPGKHAKLGLCQFGRNCKRRQCVLAHPGGRVNGADDQSEDDQAPMLVPSPPLAAQRVVVKLSKKAILQPTPEQIREAERLEALEREAELEQQRVAEIEAERVREVIRARKIKKEQDEAKRAAEEEERLRREQQQQELEQQQQSHEGVVDNQDRAWYESDEGVEPIPRPSSAPAPASAMAASSSSSSAPVVAQQQQQQRATFREEFASFELDPLLFEDQSSAEAMKCSVCLMVAKDPPAAPCGHIFCRSCLEAAPVEQRKCPECRVPIKLSACPSNVFVARHIASLKMRCPNHEAGCNAVLTPGQDNKYLTQHETECEHAAVVCNQCNAKIKRMEKASHKCAQTNDLGMRLAERDSRLVYQAGQVAAQQREIQTLRTSVEQQKLEIETQRAQLEDSMYVISTMQVQIKERDALISVLESQLESKSCKVNSLRTVLLTACEEFQKAII